MPNCFSFVGICISEQILRDIIYKGLATDELVHVTQQIVITVVCKG